MNLKTSKLVKISPKTAYRTENFSDGFPTNFFQNFETTKNERKLPNQPFKTKFIKIHVVLLFFINKKLIKADLLQWSYFCSLLTRTKVFCHFNANGLKETFIYNTLKLTEPD
jgi:hypothetical protein